MRLRFNRQVLSSNDPDLSPELRDVLAKATLHGLEVHQDEDGSMRTVYHLITPTGIQIARSRYPQHLMSALLGWEGAKLVYRISDTGEVRR